MEFRPHHFLCTLGFQGKGYNLSFIQNYQTLVDQLHQDDLTPIQVTFHQDAICQACPHHTPVTCGQQEKIRPLDDAYARLLSLKDGEVMTWRQAQERVKRSITLEDFHKACSACSWKSLGVCEQALENLLAL